MDQTNWDRDISNPSSGGHDHIGLIIGVWLALVVLAFVWASMPSEPEETVCDPTVQVCEDSN